MYDPTNEREARERGLTVETLRRIQAATSMSNGRIAALGEGQLARLLRKLAIGDRPRQRAEYQGLFEQSEDGYVTPGGKLRALEQLSEVRQGAPVADVAGVPSGEVHDAAELSPPPLIAGAGLAPSGAGWTSLGPGRVGGRTRAIVVDPNDPDTIWLGSVGGGIWRTSDAGAHWHPVDDRMANLAVTSIVMDPNNPNVLYGGTGEGFHNADAIRGAGIFRTINAAAWSQLPATDTEDFHWVNRLAISADGSILLAATRTGIHRSADGDRANWDLVASGNFTDVRFHPDDSDLAIAGGAPNQGRALFSIDGGLTWNVAAGIPAGDRVELTYAAADPDFVYASVDMNPSRIFRSTDGGASYQARASENANGFPAQYLGQQGWYDNTIWAGDPDTDLVVVGGIDLWRSTDGGDTLERISSWSVPGSAHADHHAIVSHPDYDGGANRTVFFANDGGIYRTDDVTTVGNDPDHIAGWVNLVNGYAVTQFYGAAGHAGTGTIIGGAQDNGTLAFRPATGPNAWVEILGGDGGYCGADPVDPNFFYSEYVRLDIHRNDNGATSDAQWWLNYISGSFYNPLISDWDRKPLPFRIPDAGTNDALFIAPFAVDPNDGNRILAGGASLWRTDDARTANTNSTGPTWESVKPPLTTSFGQRNLISAVAIARGDSDVVWVGHEGGNVFRSRDADNAQPTWLEVGGNGPLPGRMCTRLVIDPDDHDRVYVTFGGYDPGNVWTTDDAGASWQDLSGSLPDAPVRCLAIHPRRPTYLYLGTELGIFTSEDRGANWSPTNEGPTNCPVSDLIWMAETLVCATHGRGMFSIDLSGIPDPP
ncbi:MAG TPA: hypothetical protein VMT85_16525 [Thermoanaerobaculia bacterium]|nr:hypothetical protein [Thermoanaerobaculia bacterium]